MVKLYRNVRALVAKTVKGVLDPYHPEKYYMQGERDRG